ncbi:hypothetical protein BJ742DRAFT_824094 [Cladochytrium replicatum]|nr:hypothetical protein BJ742DRAFT_824094 [Cladochytrium replicatum]
MLVCTFLVQWSRLSLAGGDGLVAEGDVGLVVTNEDDGVGVHVGSDGLATSDGSDQRKSLGEGELDGGRDLSRYGDTASKTLCEQSNSRLGGNNDGGCKGVLGNGTKGDVQRDESEGNGEGVVVGDLDTTLAADQGTEGDNEAELLNGLDAGSGEGNVGEGSISRDDRDETASVGGVVAENSRTSFLGGFGGWVVGGGGSNAHGTVLWDGVGEGQGSRTESLGVVGVTESESNNFSGLIGTCGERGSEAESEGVGLWLKTAIRSTINKLEMLISYHSAGNGGVDCSGGSKESEDELGEHRCRRDDCCKILRRLGNYRHHMDQAAKRGQSARHTI